MWINLLFQNKQETWDTVPPNGPSVFLVFPSNLLQNLKKKTWNCMNDTRRYLTRPFVRHNWEDGHGEDDGLANRPDDSEKIEARGGQG
jgi:hypothetical protein